MTIRVSYRPSDPVSVRTYIRFRYRMARRSGMSHGGARDVIAAICEAHNLPLPRRNGKGWQ